MGTVRPEYHRAIVGGMAATVAMTMMMYWIAPLALGGPMDIAGQLGTVTGTAWLAGMLMHLALGSLVFPIIYAGVLYPLLVGPGWMQGLAWGVVLWVGAELVIMPLAGAGVFHAVQGGFLAATASFVGHAAYGLLLGAIADGYHETDVPVRTRVDGRA